MRGRLNLWVNTHACMTINMTGGSPQASGLVTSGRSFSRHGPLWQLTKHALHSTGSPCLLWLPWPHALEHSQLQAALSTMGPDIRPLLRAIQDRDSGACWATVKNRLLAALQDIVDAFPQDFYPAPRRLQTSHVEAVEAQVAILRGMLQQLQQQSTEKVDLSPLARLHGAMMMHQLDETAVELRRLHTAAQAAMDGLERKAYGFCGFTCCAPAQV